MKRTLATICLTVAVLLGSAMLSAKNSIAHEGIKKVPIDCSTEIIQTSEFDLVAEGMVSKTSRRTHFLIPINFVKKHIEIPVDIEGTFLYRLSVIAVGKGSYKFKDTVSIPISNKDGLLKVVDPFGLPWKEVPSKDKGKQITDVECFLVM